MGCEDEQLISVSGTGLTVESCGKNSEASSIIKCGKFLLPADILSAFQERSCAVELMTLKL